MGNHLITEVCIPYRVNAVLSMRCLVGRTGIAPRTTDTQHKGGSSPAPAPARRRGMTTSVPFGLWSWPSGGWVGSPWAGHRVQLWLMMIYHRCIAVVLSVCVGSCAREPSIGRASMDCLQGLAFCLPGRCMLWLGNAPSSCRWEQLLSRPTLPSSRSR